MMTVEIRTEGKLDGRIELVCEGKGPRGKILYKAFAVEEIPGKDPFRWGPKMFLYTLDSGSMQMLSNALAALGWKPKSWSVPK